MRRDWRPAVLLDRRAESPSAYTLALGVEKWSGHLPGQHIDVRLTAPDGYQAARSYSLAGPAVNDRLEVTVQRIADGEVSPFLTSDFTVGDQVEVRGPLGGWFVWHPESVAPVLLVAGGSGVVPLMSMIRARDVTTSAPFHLVYSVRTPEDRIYSDELLLCARRDRGLTVTFVYTRTSPADDPRPPGRLRAEDLVANGWGRDLTPTCYVCGPTGFVEAVAGLLVAGGHDPRQIRTERFGGD